MNKLKTILPSWLAEILKKIRGLLRGTWPLQIAQTNLAKSASFESLTGKIRYKMAFDRNPILATFADKKLVRNYVAEKVGDKYLSELIGIVSRGEDLRKITLPSEFAIKSNNGSGAMILVSRTAPIENSLPAKPKKMNWEKYLVSLESFNLESAINLIDVWMNQNYYYRTGHFPEWAYKEIQPVVVIEELMYDTSGRLPADYKFFMIDGKCEFIQIDNSRYETHTRDLFTPTWSRLEVRNVYPNNRAFIPKPKLLEEMLQVAEKLSSGIEFVRVDLYETSKGVKFGELTNYPGGGIEEYEPEEFGRNLGSHWKPNYSDVN